MMIEADGYAYWCSDKNVDIGDTVIVTVSAGWDNIFGRVAERTVSSLSSDYAGPCESVVKVIKKSQNALSPYAPKTQVGGAAAADVSPYIATTYDDQGFLFFFLLFWVDSLDIPCR